MRYNKKNVILIDPKKYRNSMITNFFSEMGIEVQYQYEKDTLYMFIVDDYCLEDNLSPRLYLSSCEKNRIHSYFDSDLMNNPVVNKILHFKFSNTNSNDLHDEYLDNEKQIFTLKVQDYLNTGFLIDRVVNYAYKNNVLFEKVRNFYNTLFLEYSNKVVDNDSSALFDVAISYSEGVLVSKIIFGLNEDKLVTENVEFLRKLSSMSNYVSMDLYGTKNKMIITSAWFSDELLQNYRCYFFEDLNSMESLKTASQKKISGLNIKDISYEGANSIKVSVNKLSLARKLTFYLKTVLRYEDTVSPESLMIHEIDGLLVKYPNQKNLKDVDDEVRKIVLKLLKEENLNQGFDEFVNEISESSVNAQLSEMKRIFLTKNLKDVEELVIFSNQSKEKKSTADKISQWYEPTLDHSISANEKWENKKRYIVSLIDQEIGKQTLVGNQLVAEDIVKIISSEINAPVDDIRFLVKEIVSEAISVTVFGEDGVNLCMELLQVKQNELNKLTKENGQLKTLAVKSMNAYKDLASKKSGNIDQSDLIYIAEIKQLRLKNDVAENRLKNQSLLIDKLESSMKIKESENHILKNRLATKEREKDDLFKGTLSVTDDKFMQRLKMDKKVAEDAQISLYNDVKKQEKQLTLLNNQHDDLRKRKFELDLEFSEKKKEALRLKNENSGLQYRISELERKIALYEKKIS